MQARDVRAVENPITAIFDLADDVEKQAPNVRKLLTYTRVFVYVWLVLDFFLILIVSVARVPAFFLMLALYGLLLIRTGVTNATLGGFLLAASVVAAVFVALTFGPGIVLGAVLVSLFYLGMVILGLVQDARRFLDYYALRYRVVRAVREADPVVHVPQGRTAVDRLLVLLARRSSGVAAMLEKPGGARVPAIVTGRSGVAYEFDAFLSWPAGTLAPIGLGHAGSAVYVKHFERVPSRADLEALRRAVEDVTPALRLPPVRVLALWQSDGKTEVPDDTYAFLTQEVVRTRVGARTHVASMELVTEMPDGTYDFIPIVVEAPTRPRPASAPQRA